MPNFLQTNPNQKIAYEQIIGNPNISGVIFCSGFMSDMQGTKALALENFCRELNCSYVRFDYRGCGQSSGEFTEGTISRWLEDTLAILDQATTGPQIVVGSSMGGWIALLLALARPERIKAYIGIAAAPDFTEDLMWATATAEQQAELLKNGVLYEKSDYSEQSYVITKALIEDGRQRLLLRNSIPLTIPVHLLQGMQDKDVPWQRSMLLTEKLQSQDIRLTLIKDGDHRLTREQDLALLRQTLINCF